MSYVAQGNDRASRRFIIDSTKLDPTAVASREAAIRRAPVIYVVVDEFTAEIVGFSMGVDSMAVRSFEQELLLQKSVSRRPGDFS